MPIYKVDGVKKDGLQKYKVRINFLDGNGKKTQLTRVAYGCENAKELEQQLLLDLKANIHSIAFVVSITVQELFDEFINAMQYELRETTLRKHRDVYSHHIQSILGCTKLNKLTTRVLQNWKLEIEKKKLSSKMKKNIYGELRCILNYAVKLDYLQKNPLLKLGNFKSTLECKKEMDFYTSDDFLKFIKAAYSYASKREQEKNSLAEWNYYVFFNIAFYTGLRKGEIHALKWTDIKGGYLTVSRSIVQILKGADRETAPKNKSSIRTLQLPKPLIRILNEHKERQRQLPDFNEDFRICGAVRSLRDTSLQNKNALYARLAGVKKIRIHDFRHSHVSLLANSGINIQEIARRLGHSDIEMTWNTYSHLYPREEEKAINILDMVV
ncbi:MAG: site-specific integrase [Clostridiales bacterium]|nr:site-specific integrase [Clostridiales bacterium]